MIFLESPWPILFLGIAVEAILAVILVRTGRGVVLAYMAGAGLIVLIGLAVERQVVTERERVAQTLDGAAAALESNDLDRLLEFIAPNAAATRERARWALGLAEFLRVRVRNLEVTIIRTTSPPTAKATFTATVTARDRHGPFGEQTRPVRLTVRLRREAERWLVTDHEILDDLRGL